MINFDKKQVAINFRQRLQATLDESGLKASDLSRKCGLDRSALSQFLNGKNHRVPRSDTLVAIASVLNVSIDWLLGLSQDVRGVGEVAKGMSIEHASSDGGQSLLSKWHEESAGYKIRYAPSNLPDLLRTPAVARYEFDESLETTTDIKQDLARTQLNYSRSPETDMEVVMPFQKLSNLADGADIWQNLQRGARQAQLEHIAQLCDELYPTFRLFLYDARIHYSAPFTVFGPNRAALYIGDMYIVVNSVEHIRELTLKFDSLIRVAEVTPDQVSDWISKLKVK
jgi:transcriptional regulator with XRE-family HTH domain